jgi:RES domain-containing protein
VRFVGRCYRGHDPSWSFSPESGDGAAIRGGRFNRKGEAALYLSLDIATAVGECTQGLSQRMPPLTMCEYDVDCDDIADLRTEPGRKAMGVKPHDLDCAWLDYLLAGKQAPSWLMADRLKERGHSGILVASFFPGAGADNVNLVLWRWSRDLPHAVRVYDPTGRLPKDQSSWR